MDDEEEDMSRPISQLWGTPCRDVKDRPTPISAGRVLTAVTGAAVSAPPPQTHNNNIISSTMPCSLHRHPRIPFHGNAGLRSHFPAQFEPMEDRGERQIEDEEEDEMEEEEEEEREGRGEENDRMAERPQEQAGVSVEVQIGRKLRQIGDKFHQDHVELFMRHQRQNLPLWMRLSMALFGFLFPREAVVPRLRGEHR